MADVTMVIERVTKNKLNPEKLSAQLATIANIAASKVVKVTGEFQIDENAEPIMDEDFEDKILGYRYVVTIGLSKKNSRTESSKLKAIEKAKEYVEKAARNYEWKIQGDKEAVDLKKDVIAARGPFEFQELSKEVMEGYFGEVYERESHLRIIHKSTETAIKTGFNQRNHVLLYGQPAAAKSILLNKMKEWYEAGQDFERVLCINATALTKAGLENWLIEKSNDGLLEHTIVFIDEIEKLDTNNLACLLNVMDGSGRIKKLNSRVNVDLDCRILIWATANNDDKVKQALEGALFSRFAHALHCKRPTRELMYKIAEKRLEDWASRGMQVEMEWAKIVTDFAFDKLKTTDPRKILALLDGRDELTTGYLDDVEKTFTA